MRILIVGGGIAGHTLGCAFAKRNIACEIVEQRANWEIVGAGMYVQNNALRGLDDIGVADEVVARGWHASDNTSIVADKDGHELARTTIPPCPGSAWPGTNPISRKLLHDILHDAAEKAAVPVRMSTSVWDIVDREGGDRVEVEFTDGTNGRYDLVVGADGIRSKVRSFLFPDVAPVYSGFSNWRIVLPRPDELERVMWQVGPGKSVGLIPISATEMYFAGVSKEPGNPHFDNGEFLTLLRERFSQFGGLAGRLLGTVRSPDQIVYTPIEEVLLPRPWSRGRVVLLGDAAHASTPFWAQGASMAIEDCIVLARLCAAGGDIGSILAEWEQRRFERCLFVQEGSRRAGQALHREGDGVMDEIYAYARANAQRDLTNRYLRMNEPI
jgi:2-polyprenyl-6-methoxyphenol hydroxylase-like FAD-dependent oxidoreductase